MEAKARNRFEKRPSKRILEIAIYLVISFVLLLIGLRLDDINYSLFFYMMSALFFLAIFRPKVLP